MIVLTTSGILLVTLRASALRSASAGRCRHRGVSLEGGFLSDAPPAAAWVQSNPEGGQCAGNITEQLSLANEEYEQLARAERFATWKAFVAPLASNAGAVIDDPELVDIAVHILAVFADQPTRHGLTRAQIRDGLRRRGISRSEDDVEARLEHLERMGFMEPYLLKSHQDRYIVRPAGMAGALAAARVAERGGVDELLVLLDRTREALTLEHADPAQILAYLNTCRYTLINFALALQRRIASGTAGELIAASRQHDHSKFTDQVVALNDLVTARFARHFEMDQAGADLIQAELFYRTQVLAAVEKVIAQGGSSLNFDVLTPAEYENAAVTADLDQLAELGTALVSDAPPTYLDPEALLDAVDQYQPRPRNHLRPPEPRLPVQDEHDPLTALELAHARAVRRRRLALESILDGRAEVDLLPHMRVSWPAAAEIITDALLLDADPAEPFVLDLEELLLIDPEAKVTYLHPARLIRTDPPLDVPAGTAATAHLRGGVDGDR
ncbi:hypothetical protein [Micromonospora chalcea]|uniref:hypothetical protein n=1 Tax=Micromonospora chalcea TaxID=1874 RepID=UPI00379BBC9F